MAITELKDLKGMDVVKQATFAYLACERLFPNYVYFSENYHFGNPSTLRKVIDFIHDHLLELEPNKNQITSHIKEIEKNTPGTEDFTTTFVSSALDACAAIFESLNFLVDKNFSRIETISTLATDTVDMYIQEIEALDFNKDKDFRQKINNHFLMKKEVAIQSGITGYLNSRKSIDSDDIQTLLNLQESNKKGSLGL
jgi:uncharacterized protein YjaG (DUF416 family)